MYPESSFCAEAWVLCKRDKKGAKMACSCEALPEEITVFAKVPNCKKKKENKRSYHMFYKLKAKERAIIKYKGKTSGLFQ